VWSKPPANKRVQPTAAVVAFLTLAILRTLSRSLNGTLAGAAADAQAVGPPPSALMPVSSQLGAILLLPFVLVDLSVRELRCAVLLC